MATTMIDCGYFPSCSNSIPGENGNFLHWKFSKGANKISNSISCGEGGRNGPEARPAAKVIPTPLPLTCVRTTDKICNRSAGVFTVMSSYNGQEAACSKSYSSFN